MNWLFIDPIEHKRRHLLWRECEEWLCGTGEFITPTINITVDELLERYAAGERDFMDVCLPEKSELTGVSLAGAILLGANLSGVNFTDVNLTNCDLRYSWLYGTNLTRANLEGANIDYCHALGAIFINASLLNTVGGFGVKGGALFEDTIMRDGSIRSYEGRD
jgi:Pentapeptide repeats (8 copies)